MGGPRRGTGGTLDAVVAAASERALRATRPGCLGAVLSTRRVRQRLLPQPAAPNRTGAPAIGTPGAVKGAIANGQLARRYSLPWRSLVNPFQPLEILSADQVEAIHEASLRILSEIGLEVLGDRALDTLHRAGASVDRANRRVRLDPAQVEDLVATAPSTFRLHARNPERDLAFGAPTSSSGQSAAPPSSAISTAAGVPATLPTSSTTSG